MSKVAPKVSVVLSVYNGSDFVRDAIASILDQTFTDFELIIINDGSTDQTLKVIQSFSDERIRLISRENRGLVHSLNEGIQNASAPIIARQDADDISEPERLSKQYAAFQKNTAIIGASIITIDSAGDVKNTHHVLHGRNTVRHELLVRSPFAHGSVMFSKALFEQAGGYKQAEWPAEDYGLWVRLAVLGSCDNVQEPLYRYRENEHGISSANAKDQQAKANAARDTAWSLRGLVQPFRRIETQKFDIPAARQIDNYREIVLRMRQQKKYFELLKLVTCFVVSPHILYNGAHILWRRLRKTPKSQ